MDTRTGSRDAITRPFAHSTVYFWECRAKARLNKVEITEDGGSIGSGIQSNLGRKLWLGMISCIL